MCVCEIRVGGWGLRWWDTGSDPVTLPAAPGVKLQSGGRGDPSC